jgi:hypothetical protein
MSRKNKRRSKRNPIYVPQTTGLSKNRRGRRLRRNFFKLYGKDVITDIAMPAGYATGGFLIANALSNLAANSDQVRGVLDAGRGADAALATKSVANAAVIAGALGLAAWASKSGNKMITENATPVLTGMGLALFARLLRGTGLAPYLGRLGEYVEQPMGGFGEYVEQPMQGLGAYVDDPSHGMGRDATYYAAAGLGRETYYAAAGYHEGIDPANQEGVDGLMDVMEAAGQTGTPVMEAAAGVGQTFYAAAGLGGFGEYIEETDVDGWYAKNPSFVRPGSMTDGGRMEPPFASIQTPVEGAKLITGEMPYERKIPSSLVTPEGRGYAGGVFARHLFGGMF